MILVMESAKLFHDDEGQSLFWKCTRERVDKFLPNLRNELFRHHATGEYAYILVHTWCKIKVARVDH